MLEEVKELAERLGDKQLVVRAAAAEQLCQLGPQAQAAAASLVIATGDDESVSVWAVAALEDLGAPAASDIAELTAMATHSHELIAYWAVTLLGRLAPDNAQSEQALVTALEKSPHLAVRQRAAWALGKLTQVSSAAMESLKRACEDSDPRLSRLAAQAFAKHEA